MALRPFASVFVLGIIVVTTSSVLAQDAQSAEHPHRFNAPRRTIPTGTTGLQSATTQKDVPTIVRETADSAVLVVVMDSAGREIRQGSGFVVSADGKIVTNYHVIEGATSAVVKLPSGAFFEVEGVLGTDVSKDLAVLKAAGRGFTPRSRLLGPRESHDGRGAA